MQTLPNPGLILKIIYDHLPNIRAIATGSTSFDLANKLTEPLTGRHDRFLLYPFSFVEVKSAVSALDLKSTVENCLIYGSYPKIFNITKLDEKEKNLRLLSEAYPNSASKLISFDSLESMESILLEE